MSITKGTPASSQIITLERLLTESNAENERLRIELSELRKQQAEAVANSATVCNVFAAFGERYDDRLSPADNVRRLIQQQAASVPDDDDTIRERDCYHDWADKLADAIAEFTGADIGEHSYANNPWQNALDALDELDPKQQTSAPDLSLVESFKAQLIESVSPIFWPHIEAASDVIIARMKASAPEAPKS